MSKMDLRSSVGIRLFIVVLMTFLLLIPSLIIQMLISERQKRRDEVAGEISRNWGTRQILIGPVLSIPFMHRTYDVKKNVVDTVQYMHFLPERLDVKGDISPETRNRSIYQIVVYNSNLDISAAFKPPEFDAFSISPENILWQDASVWFGISDMKGVKDPVKIDWNDKVIEAHPGIPSNDLVPSGISIPFQIESGRAEFSFHAKLNLSGSFELLFSPIGKETTVQLSSDWRNPSFTGDYLPTRREVDETGFKSDWRVLHVSREFPQQWVGTRYNVEKSLFGVSLLLSVDQYQMTTRTVKYAIMFIALTFATFFVIEILSGRPIHPIQYLLIGFALLIFYTLLLSLSEYVPFGYAYLVAAMAIVILITGYSASFLGSRFRSGIVALVMAMLYGYLYVILQLQDYALLMGSLMLFVALALTMYLTRAIDWFSVLNYRKMGE